VVYRSQAPKVTLDGRSIVLSMGLLANSGTAALDAIVVAAMVVPIPVLGVICWIFWKAKQREDVEREVRQPPRG
jgi:uncharacterized paraquat-inducible protein A